MSEDNIFTEAKDETLSFMNEVTGDVHKMFKNKNPYNQRKVSKQEITNAYLSMTQQDKITLIGKYGRDAQDYFAELDMEINSGSF